mgnify:CR=1 FL=1
MSEPGHPCAWSDKELLAICREERWHGGGPGGQHQNKTESGVRYRHIPTQIAAERARWEAEQARLYIDRNQTNLFNEDDAP